MSRRRNGADKEPCIATVREVKKKTSVKEKLGKLLNIAEQNQDYKHRMSLKYKKTGKIL